MRWVVYWSLFVASFKMFVRNRAALFFSLFVPLLIMLIFGVLNFGGSTSVSLGLVDEAQTDGSHALVKALQQTDTFDLHPGAHDAELAQLKEGHRDLVLVIPAGYQLAPPTSAAHGLVAYSNRSKPEQAQVGALILNALVGQLLASGGGGSGLPLVSVQALPGRSSRSTAATARCGRRLRASAGPTRTTREFGHMTSGSRWPRYRRARIPIPATAPPADRPGARAGQAPR